MQYKFIFLFWSLQMASLSAQLSIEWQKSLGGTSTDAAYYIQQTNDGGYIVAGFSLTNNNGDVTGNHGGGDIWVVKLNELGNIQWQKSLGGSSTEVPRSIQQTSDGGYILAGKTFSEDGDVTGNHGNGDYWVVKLNELGTIEWQKALGGSNVDDAKSVQQTNDGGYIVAGFSASIDGEVSGNHGNDDAWIIKLSVTGVIEWQRSFGGSGSDRAYCISQTIDGGYIIAGETDSMEGDLFDNHGSGDFWVLKLNSFGEIQWQKALGGIGIDQALCISQASDGGYVVIGTTGSGNSGNVSGTHGGFDIWVVKLNPIGAIQWQKAFGGSAQDYGNSIEQTGDGGYALVGTTQSNDGDVLNNDGLQDYWVLKLNHLGEIQRQKTLGGTNIEWAYCLQKTNDGGFIIAGRSDSNDGDVTGNHGGDDFWVVKLRDYTLSTQSPQAPLSIFPNPAHTSITLQIPAAESTLHVSINDLLGRTLSQRTLTNGGQIDIAALPTGLYLLSATTEAGQVYVGKLRKE